MLKVKKLPIPQSLNPYIRPLKHALHWRVSSSSVMSTLLSDILLPCTVDPWTPSQQDPSKENESARWQHNIQLGSNSLTSLNNQFKALVHLHQAVPPKPSSPIYIYIIYINLKSWFLPVLWFSGGLENKNCLICDVCTAANSTTTLGNCETHSVTSCGTKSERNRF